MSVKSKSGYIYLVHAIGTNRYKIGLTTRTIEERFAELNSSQSAYPLECVCSMFVDNVHDEEKYLHKKYAPYRVHGEWFEFSQSQAKYVATKFRKNTSSSPILPKFFLIVALGLVFIWIQSQLHNHETIRERERLEYGTRN